MNAMERFRDEVGADGAVCVRGGGTRWTLGTSPYVEADEGPEVRVVTAPQGIQKHDPAEMTVMVGAGTALTDLAAALSLHGQEVALEGPPGSTVGGTLAVGHSSVRRPRIGAARDTLLQAECVGADGALFKAGGPTVKNVTGYDLCRLLVGSLGTLALLGRVILRTRPVPEQTIWMTGGVLPSDVLAACYRPAGVLWDGTSTFVRLEGYSSDVRDEAQSLALLGLSGVDGPPSLPMHRDRWRGTLPAGGVLEVSTGVLHRPDPAPAAPVAPAVRALADRVRAGFDPGGRLNPGRDPYLVTA